MSTTVTYKGQTLTTVSNQTKVLNTSGTWLEDDITLVDSSASAPTLQSKSATPTESQQIITADTGYDGLSSVTVGAIASNYIGSGVNRISSNSGIKINGATVTVQGAAYYTGNVSKTIPLQSKTVTPSESEQTVTPDTGNSGLSSVTVGAISNTYVGSGITRQTTASVEDDIISGLEDEGAIFIPSGYYSSDCTISAGGTVSHSSPTISVSSSGLITATHVLGIAGQGGYVSSLNTGTTTATQQLATQAATTITPTTSSQQAVASGVYTTGVITVNPIPSNYITTSDATASASDIVSGQTAYANGNKVTGNLVIQHFYQGSSSPSASLGENGDIYLQS